MIEQSPAAVAARASGSDVMSRLKALLKEKNFAAALEEARRVLANQPRHVGALSAAASAAFALGRDEEALDFIRKALYIQPDSGVLKESLRRIQKRIDDNKT